MILGFSGKIGVGKTTTADLMVHKLGGDWKRVSFADALRKECTELFGDLSDKGRFIDVDQGRLFFLGVVSVYPERLSVRQILQMRGQYMRTKKPNYWVDKFAQQYKNEGNLIIDDVRYVNEAQHVQRMGGFLIRIQPYASWKPGPASDHISETNLDEWGAWDGIVSPEYGRLDHLADSLILSFQLR